MLLYFCIEKLYVYKKIYVAGCFDDYTEIRKIQEIFIGHGYEISYDWTIRAEQTIKNRKKYFR